MPFFVYVLLNRQGKTYVGQTGDLPRRLSQHNDPNCRMTLHTKRHPGPWRLLHLEEFSDKETSPLSLTQRCPDQKCSTIRVLLKFSG